jgi:hypothetical protein
VSFHPGAIAGAGSAGGSVDYRLARHGLIEEYRKGRIARHEVCDAHPELKRAAANVARPTKQDCPICQDEYLVLVTYAFGSYLPARGRVVEDRKDMNKIRRMVTECRCYVVEVCPSCGWNHLVQTFDVEGRRRA